MVDTWQVGSRRGYVPSSFYGKLISKCFSSSGFQSSSIGFSSISSCFQGKILQFLYFLLSIELRNHFPKVFEKFELVLALFYRFLGAKQ